MRIVYFDLDCCRPDHLGAYGYHRDTSPNLDRIAREGVVFTNCFTSNSPCVPSRAALFSGRFGINNGVVAHHGPGAVFRDPGRGPRHPMPMRYLRAQGVKTVSFSCFADRHRAWWFGEGWEELHTFTLKGGQETADEVNAAALPWVRAHGAEDDYFLHVHYWDIHSHYRISREWSDRFRDDPPPDWPDEEAIERNLAIYGPRTGRDLYTGYRDEDHSPHPGIMPDGVRNRDEFKMLIGGYDGAIRYVDHHVGQILDALADQGVLDDTAIIISGDHGDSFGEHGQYMDHGLANGSVNHIPMIVRWPGAASGATSESLIYGLDLPPTLCDMLGKPIPEGWDGESFAAGVRGEPFAGRDFLVLTHGIYTLQRAVRTREWLYIETLHPGLYPYEDTPWLFDVVADPRETRNLASERPEAAERMQSLYADWRARQEGPDNLEAMVPLGPFLYCDPDRMVARLRRTGREREADELIARLRRYGHTSF
jgi:choline-sulfatase